MGASGARGGDPLVLFFSASGETRGARERNRARADLRGWGRRTLETMLLDAPPPSARACLRSEEHGVPTPLETGATWLLLLRLATGSGEGAATSDDAQTRASAEC